MRLSGINWCKMDAALVNFACLVLFSAMTSSRAGEQDLVKMSENLTQIPAAVAADVEFLNLAYNQITRLPEDVFADNNYNQVRKLFLFRNNIQDISVGAFKGLKRLRTLDVSDNNITALDPYTFRTNTKLEKLILMNNRIVFDRLQTFIVCHSVETLVLSGNRITEVYGLTFLGVPNLKRLILSDNALTVVAPVGFKSLRRLRFLSLANTGVYRLTEAMFLRPPTIVNLENTPLGKRFEPPLRQVTDEAVTALLRFDELVY